MMSIHHLNLLHRRYDGPIPEREMTIARYGSLRRFDILRANAMARYFRAEAVKSIRRMRRQSGAATVNAYGGRPIIWDSGLVSELEFNLRERRKWRRYLRWLAATRKSSAAAGA